jgi:Flp pilus assembly protein TadD
MIIVTVLLFAAAPLYGQSPSVARQLSSDAIALYKKGKVEEAIVSLQKAIVMDSTFVDAYLALGQMYVETGRLKQAQTVLQQAARFTKKDPRIHLALGVAHFEQAHFQDALKQFNRVLELDPDNSRAKQLLSLSRLNLGVEEYQNGRKTQALEHFESAVKVDPRNANAYRNLAVVLYETDQFVKAKEALLKGLKSEPGDKKMLQMLLQLCEHEKDFKGAQDAAENLHKYNPKDIDIALHLAYLYRFNNEADRAFGLYQSLLKQHPKEKRIYDEYSDLYVALSQYDSALAVYAGLLTRTPGEKKIYEDVARIYTEAKRYDSARTAYRKVLCGNEDDKRIYQKVAETYITEGHQEMAVSVYREALTQFTDDWELNSALGLLCEKVDSADAITTYRRMIGIQASNPYPYVRLGIVYSKLDSAGAAAENFRKAVELNSQDPLPYHKLSEWAVAKGDTDNVRAYEHQAVTHAVQTISKEQSLLLAELGKSKGSLDLTRMESMNRSAEEITTAQKQMRESLENLFRWEKLEFLEADLKDLLKEYPKEPVLTEYLGLLYEREGQYDVALSTYEQLLKTDARNKGGHLGMARIWEKTGKEEDAMLAYKRALTLDSKEPQILERLVELYERKGRISELVDEWLILAKRESNNTVLLKNLLVLLEKTGREKEQVEIKKLLKDASP